MRQWEKTDNLMGKNFHHNMKEITSLRFGGLNLLFLNKSIMLKQNPESSALLPKHD